MELDYLYPAATQPMLEHIDDVINTHGTELSEGNLARMSEDLIRRSTMGGDPPRGHTRSTLNDLAQLLLLQRLIEQGAIPYLPYQPIYVLPPFFPQYRPQPPRPVHPIQPIRPSRPR